MKSWLQCLSCGARYAITERLYHCTACDSLLDVQHDLETIRDHITLDLFDERLKGYHAWERSGVWRFHELIAPQITPQDLVTRGEGNTTLYDAPLALTQYVRHSHLQLKHEGENPTGSFKDRGMASGVTQAKFLGAKAVICASTGNTSASMASFARLVGLQAVVVYPAGKVAIGKIAQSIAYGATCIEVLGDFDDAQRLVIEIADQFPIYMLNSVNPFRLEGQKAIMLELLQQRRWRVPDWIVVPGGNLGNSSAFGKAFYELHTMNLIDRIPHIAIVQAENAAPLYHSWQTQFQEQISVKAETRATAIRIGNPTNYLKAKRTLEFTHGLVLTVSDQEIMDAKAQVDGVGIGCEPASAASVAGVRKLVAAGTINSDDEVVAILTGHLLKDPTAVIEYHSNAMHDITPTYPNVPHQIPVDINAFAALLEKQGLSSL